MIDPDIDDPFSVQDPAMCVAVVGTDRCQGKDIGIIVERGATG